MDDDPIDWGDTEEIGYRLSEAHPDVDPLTLRFTEMHGMVLALPGFTGEPKASNEKILEAILMAWIDERD